MLLRKSHLNQPRFQIHKLIDCEDRLVLNTQIIATLILLFMVKNISRNNY